MKDLHPYQVPAADRCEAALLGPPECSILVAPTGSGKTVIFSEAIKRVLATGRRGVAYVHRDHLADQTAAQAIEQGITDVTFMKAGRTYNPAAKFCIASVQTCKRRKLKPPADFVVGDEFHLATIHKWITEYHSDVPRLGATATPQLYGGRTLAQFAHHLIIAARPSQLIEQKYIVPPRIWVPYYPDLAHSRLVGGDYSEQDLERVMGRTEVIGNVVEHWQRNASTLPGPTIVFAVNRTHASALVDRFRGAGTTVAMITGETGDNDRAGILARVREGTVRVLINVAVFIEGYDLPGLSAVQVARPTRSLALWLQMCGRGCRTAPGKANFVLLDHGGNTFRLGHPFEDRPWSLETAVVRKRLRDITKAAVRQCPVCFYVYTGSANACPACGTGRPSRWVTEHNGTLVDVTEQISKSPLHAPAQQTQELANKFRRQQWAKIRGTSLPPHAKAAWVRNQMTKFWEEVLRSG